MNWITFLWPMVAAACITMGLIHLRIGPRREQGGAHLLFALTANLFAAFACLELSILMASSPAQFLELQRWVDFVGSAGVVSVVGFVWVFFGTGRRWLALLGCGLVCGSLILNLFPGPKLVFLQMTGIRTVDTFGGASFTVGEGIRNPWVAVFYLGILFIAAFVVDASVSLWRQGGRRRAAVIGGSIVFFLLGACAQSWIVDAGILPIHLFVRFFYLAILIALALELSDEVLQASQLAHDLGESEGRLKLAADAAHLGLWVWDVEQDEIWTTPQGRSLFGFAATERLDSKRLVAAVHPADRDAAEQSITNWLRTAASIHHRLARSRESSAWLGR